MKYVDHRPKNIILFTGLSASGKSTLAERLGQEISTPVISLRQEVLHPIAVENGYARARFWLLATRENPSLLDLERNRLAQIIGIKSETSNSRNVIIDDLIDPGTPRFLREFFDKSKISVVFIKSNRHLRRRWIIKKTNWSYKEALHEQKWLDGVKIKSGIFQTIKEADFYIKNTSTIENAIAELKFLLESLS